MESLKHEGWILTRSGKRFNPFQPDINAIDSGDIAFALSNLCRFTGHSEFYSVCQHSIITGLIVQRDLNGSPKAQFAALLHDGHEAYVNDLASPVKRFLPQYCALCDDIQALIERKYGLLLSAEEKDLVHKADLIALASEATVLMTHDLNDWNLKFPPSERAVKALSNLLTPQQARQTFLNLFQKLHARTLV